MLKFLGHKVYMLKVFLIIFSLSFSVFANDSAPAKEEAAPTEGHGGGEEKGKKSDLPPWTEIQNKISQLEAKMQQKRDNLEKLISEKQKVQPNSPRVKEIIDLMISEHKELQNLAKDHEKTITILKFRFPERGAKADRKYEPTEIKTLEEMEQELGVDGRLTRNMKKLRSQYGVSSNKKQKKVEPSSEAEKKTEKTIEESGTIIIRK